MSQRCRNICFKSLRNPRSFEAGRRAPRIDSRDRQSGRGPVDTRAVRGGVYIDPGCLLRAKSGHSATACRRMNPRDCRDPPRSEHVTVAIKIAVRRDAAHRGSDADRRPQAPITSARTACGFPSNDRLTRSRSREARIATFSQAPPFPAPVGVKRGVCQSGEELESAWTTRSRARRS